MSYVSTKTVTEAARNLGISDGMLYRWRQKYTPEGEKTWYATLDFQTGISQFRHSMPCKVIRTFREKKALRFQNAEQAMEIDMLKKASACFASLHK